MHSLILEHGVIDKMTNTKVRQQNITWVQIEEAVSPSQTPQGNAVSAHEC